MGALGLVIAGLIAAIMSSIDSTMNSTATLITLDFIAPRYPNLGQKELIRVGRAIMGVLVIIAAFWAPQIINFKGLFGYLQLMFSLVVPPVVVLFIFGVFSRRGGSWSALATLAFGHLASLTLFLLQKFDLFPSLHFTLNAALIAILSAAIYILTWSLT